jgi:hypothetical protein
LYSFSIVGKKSKKLRKMGRDDEKNFKEQWARVEGSESK